MAHLGFAKLKAALAAKSTVSDPAALAAAIGRQKYGQAGMAKLAAAGRKKPRAADLMRAAKSKT